MSVRVIQFVKQLESLGYPVAFSHFMVDGDNPAPLPPYITYFTPDDSTFKADNNVYHTSVDVDVELYTYGKDFTAEKVIEDMLKRNNIPYDASQAWIESEQVFRKLYEMRLV